MARQVKESEEVSPAKARGDEELSAHEMSKRMTAALQRALHTPVSTHKKSKPPRKAPEKSAD